MLERLHSSHQTTEARNRKEHQVATVPQQRIAVYILRRQCYPFAPPAALLVFDPF